MVVPVIEELKNQSEVEVEKKPEEKKKKKYEKGVISIEGGQCGNDRVACAGARRWKRKGNN